MKVSKVALVAATMLSGSAMLAAPAFGQVQRTSQPPTRTAQPGPAAAGQAAPAAQRNYELSRAERIALQPLLAANEARNWTAVQAALPAAQAAAQGNDARYLVARVQLGMALGTENTALQDQAVATLLASPAVPASELPTLLHVQAERFFNSGDFAGAERNYVRLSQLTPSDLRVQQNLSIVRQRMGNTTGALETLAATLRTQEAAGQVPPEASYQRALQLAYNGRQLAPSLDLARRLVRNYPTASNWNNALLIYRQLGNPDGGLNIDVLRLTRAAGALQGQSDFLGFAQALGDAGLPGETRAVIDEAVSRNVLQASNPAVRQLLTVADRRIAEDRSGLTAQIAQSRTAANGRLARNVADALYGYGRYTEAADLYRVALSKGGEDADLVNTRLGASLAMAGQRAGAETAFRAVTGPRAELAQFWLAWLAGRPA